MSVRPICSRIVLALATALLPAASRAGVVVTNLVTDDQAVNAAAITDPNLNESLGYVAFRHKTILGVRQCDRSGDSVQC